MILKEYDDEKKHVHVLSYGGGTQSTALLLMALKGEINGIIPDFIIFADTGWEPQSIYDWIEKVNDHIKQRFDREIIFTSAGNLKEHVLNASENDGFIKIPAFEKKANGKKIMGRRQCTADFKITPINKKIREVLGYAPRKRVREMVHIWKGISTDEIHRAKPMRDKWQTAEHPLIDIVDIDRDGCIKYVEDEGLGTPAKSSCIGCPYHSNATWIEIKNKDPEAFADAVAFEKKLQEKKDIYLHQTCISLDQIDFDSIELKHQDLFANECEGICGI